VGDKIKNCRNLRGKVTNVNEDGTYDVVYNDGQYDDDMDSKMLQKGMINCKVYLYSSIIQCVLL
jgi:hypothetical protein